MPELPEVESVLQCLTSSNPSIINRQVQQVCILRNSVVDGDQQQLEQRLTGAVCQDVVRHGKYLFFRFIQPEDNQRVVWLALHLRMTGRLFLLPEDQAVIRHTRFYFQLDQGLVLRFDDPRAFGRIWLVSQPEQVTSTLGPDALKTGQQQFLKRLSATNRQLKPLLLDQAFLAGIGNIYADEALFKAGLHPLRKSGELSRTEMVRLYKAVSDVLSTAVSAKGANIDGVFEAGSYPVTVYGRAGQPCVKCGSEIIKERFAQRGTHFCPCCQPFEGSI